MDEVRIRNVKDMELERVLSINETYVPRLSTLTFDKLKLLQKISVYFKVILVKNEIIGFILAFEENQKYDSLNYQWFNYKYKNFIYIDRVVIIDDYQNQRLGKLLYAEIEENFKDRKNFLLAEVNTFPMNQQSILFHERNGFTGVFEKMYTTEYAVRFFEKKINFKKQGRST